MIFALLNGIMGDFPEEKLFNNVYDNPIISGRFFL